MPASLLSEKSITYANRVNPWHRMGVPMNKDGMLAVEALQFAELDYKVVKSRGFDILPDGTIRQADVYSRLWREAIPAHGKHDWEEIGTCTDKYHILQNSEIAAILDDSGITKKWKVITMGALGKGDRFFVTMEAGRFAVNGEEVESCVSILDDKSGGAALKIVQSDIVIVCLNTYGMAEASAKMSATIPHNSHIRQTFEWKARLFQQVQEAQVSFKEMAEHFAHTKVTDAEVEAVIAAIYPMPKAGKPIDISKDVDSEQELTKLVGKELLGEEQKLVGQAGGSVIEKFERAKTRILYLRDTVRTEYALTNQERPKIAGTKWAVFNAFTGAIDHAPTIGRKIDPAVRATAVTIGEEQERKIQVFKVLQGDLSSLQTVESN